MFKNWFRKNTVAVADLEEIKISPKVEFPDKTHRELYDEAVIEVQHARIRELIRREITELSVSDTHTNQTREAVNKYGYNVSDILASHIRTEFPAVYLEKKVVNEGYRIVSGPNIKTLTDNLTNLYIKELLKDE